MKRIHVSLVDYIWSFLCCNDYFVALEAAENAACSDMAYSGGKKMLNMVT